MRTLVVSDSYLILILILFNFDFKFVFSVQLYLYLYLYFRFTAFYVAPMFLLQEALCRFKCI